MTELQNLPDDVLNKILHHAEETIEEKINKIENIRELFSINKIVWERINILKQRVAADIRKGSIYEIEWVSGKTKETIKNIYLINSIFVDSKKDSINMSRVVPDTEHQRIFGNYRIADRSRAIGCGNIISYNFIHEPEQVDWSKEPRQLIGVTDIISIYGWNNPGTLEFDFIDLDRKYIIYTDRQKVMANKYSIVELFKVYKKYIVIAIPDNPMDPANNRSITTIRVAKSSCYKLNKNQESIPHIRPQDIYG